jgi:hypothetical protein
VSQGILVSTMLIELYESLCGYDRWIETNATVTSTSVEEKRHMDRYGRTYSTSNSGDVLIWTDRGGRERRGFFRVPDGSPLYSLLGGETIPIRYNPAQPDQFYMRALLESRLNRAAKQMVAVAVFLAILVLLLWLRLKHVPQH